MWKAKEREWRTRTKLYTPKEQERKREPSQKNLVLLIEKKKTISSHAALLELSFY